MPIGDFNPVPKPKHKRGKLSRRSRSELSRKERMRLHERSDGVCEHCDRRRAVHAAHIERRWKSTRRPTAEDFVHLCEVCHPWADQTAEGRAWLQSMKNNIGRGEQLSNAR